MLTSPARDRQRRLGAFLKACRARLAPGSAGFGGAARRRTPGLRREEVAQLAGLSVTWYTWIEQGRAVSFSPGALARLARVLRLSAAERRYLFDLAGKRDPEESAGPPAAPWPPGLRAAVEAISAPAYVLDRCWNALAWNKAARRLFAGWLDGRPGDGSQPNLLRFIFLQPPARRLIHGWPERARRVVAEFRAECGAFPEDAAMESLAEELQRRSSTFARLWEEQAVLGREGGLRRFNHPRDGAVSYEQITFILAWRPEYKLVILTSVRPPARGRARRTAGGAAS